jgi:hypothetical protein
MRTSGPAEDGSLVGCRMEADYLPTPVNTVEVTAWAGVPQVLAPRRTRPVPD